MASIALNQPYKPNLTIPKEKIDTLFSLMNQMDTQEIKQFSMVHSVPLNVFDTNGENLIHKAINIENILKKEFHRLNIIKFLIQNDVNPDKPNKENQTPLHLACKMQYADIVKYLIETGVNVNYQDNYGSTPFHYALQGQIKLLESDKEIKDFILPQKNSDTEKKEKLLQIKKEIWELIKDNSFIKSIEKTIYSTIFDDEIKNHSIELYKKISTKITELEEINYLKSIKEEFDIFKNKIKIIVEEKWSNFPLLSDIIIHKKEKHSYDFIGNDFSFLKNINVKEQIQSEIKNNKKKIKEICKDIYNNVIKDSFDINVENTKIMNNLYLDFYKKHPEHFRELIYHRLPVVATAAIPARVYEPRLPFYENLNVINVKISDKKFLNDWDNFNETNIFDENAVDYADNIIDWKELTFMGGSREIEIIFNFNKIKEIFNTIYNNVSDLLSFILYDFLDTDLLNNIGNATSMDQLVVTMALCKINDIDLLNKITIDFGALSPEDQLFYNKWEPLLSHKNKASAIYAMFSDHVCLPSADRLTGQMSCMISIITSALNIEEQDLLNAIRTCTKKYFIEYYLVNTLRDDNYIKTAINVLLNDNFTYDYIGNIYNSFQNNEIDQQIDALLIVPPPNQLDTKNIFLKLVTLIIEKIKKMKNKPLIQDTISLIIYINNYCLDKPNCNPSIFDTIDEYNVSSDNNLEEEILELIKNKLFPAINTEYYDLYLLIEQEQINQRLYIKADMMAPPRNWPIIAYNGFVWDGNPGTVGVEDSLINLKKFKESKHLGLYYKGLIPNILLEDDFDKTKYSDKDNKIKIKIGSQTTNDLNIHGNVIDDNYLYLPLIGNYINIPAAVAGVSLNKYEIKYRTYIKYKYRPPIKDIVKNANINIQNRIKQILSKILYSVVNEKNLYTIIDSNTRLSEAFTDIYTYLSFIYDFLDDKQIKNNIDNIIKNINEYNACLLLNEYLFQRGNKYKVKNFNYYLLPLLNNKKGSKFIYFKNNNRDNDADNETIIPDDNINVQTIIPDDNINVQTNTRNATSYLHIIENIENNIISFNYNIINNNFVGLKDDKLPPAIIGKLKDFYTYNIKLLLLELYPRVDFMIIINKIKEINKYICSENFIEDDRIMNRFIISKIVEELIKEKMKYYIELQTNRILYKVIKKKDLARIVDDKDKLIILPPQEFVLNMNKITTEISYPFSKVENLELDKFIIYPDEYANTEILKLKYELIIKKDIYNSLLEYNCNPYILDSNNQSPIFLLLKYHIPDVLEDIKYLNYNNFSEINPYNFLLLELKNHTHKLTDGGTEYKDWIENFVLYQKNEIKTLILSNNKFGNNIPLYLDDSFNIITYITNQYLSESIYENREYIDIKNLIGKKFNYKKYLFINEEIENLNVYEILENNILQNIINNNKIEINKLNNTLEKANKKYKIELTNKIDKLKEQNTNINAKINNGTTYKYQIRINNKNIIKRYEELVISKQNLTILLSKFINIDLNESYDLLTFKIITNEQKILNKSLEDNKLTYSLEIKQLSQFYEITNKISNIYFTFNKYANDNDVLKFAKDLLIFMTKRFICFSYFMLLKKTLTTYFKTIYVGDDDANITDKVNYCLTNLILKDEAKSIETLLNTDVSKKLVLNAVQIFDNQEEENLFLQESTKDIFDTVVNLLTINPSLSISEDSPFFKNIKEVNLYFDTFVNKTILNWLVIIENVFKFNINQGRIIQSIYNL
jgi:hypothetical protein